MLSTLTYCPCSGRGIIARFLVGSCICLIATNRWIVGHPTATVNLCLDSFIVRRLSRGSVGGATDWGNRTIPIAESVSDSVSATLRRNQWRVLEAACRTNQRPISVIVDDLLGRMGRRLWCCLVIIHHCHAVSTVHRSVAIVPCHQWYSMVVSSRVLSAVSSLSLVLA